MVSSYPSRDGVEYLRPTDVGLDEAVALRALNHFTIKSSLPLQGDRRSLCRHTLLCDPISELPSRASTFNPLLFKQVLYGNRSCGKFERVDPTAFTKPLHELPFTVI